MSELRWDPIDQQWTLIATERGKRPRDFLPPEQKLVDRDKAPCPFCLVLAGHGNQVRIAERRRVRQSPDSASRTTEDKVLVLANRFPVLSVETPTERRAVGPYDCMSGVGAHEVVVETTQHDLHFSTMPPEQRAQVLLMWRDRVADLLRDRRFHHIQVFRNDGPRAGATLEHAHSQVIATPIRPARTCRQVAAARDHWRSKERCLVCDILDFETSHPSSPGDTQSMHRIVDEEGDFIAWCPYASRHPFEVVIAPRTHQARFTALGDEQSLPLSRLLGRVLCALGEALSGADINLVLDLPPSSETLSRGNLGLEHVASFWHWRIELIPRLLPYGGFELGTDIQINPTAPEDAARHLRALIDQTRTDRTRTDRTRTDRTRGATDKPGG